MKPVIATTAKAIPPTILAENTPNAIAPKPATALLNIANGWALRVAKAPTAEVLSFPNDEVPFSFIPPKKVWNFPSADVKLSFVVLPNSLMFSFISFNAPFTPSFLRVRESSLYDSSIALKALVVVSPIVLLALLKSSVTSLKHFLIIPPDSSILRASFRLSKVLIPAEMEVINSAKSEFTLLKALPKSLNTSDSSSAFFFSFSDIFSPFLKYKSSASSAEQSLN